MSSPSTTLLTSEKKIADPQRMLWMGQALTLATHEQTYQSRAAKILASAKLHNPHLPWFVADIPMNAASVSVNREGYFIVILSDDSILLGREDGSKNILAPACFYQKKDHQINNDLTLWWESDARRALDARQWRMLVSKTQSFNPRSYHRFCPAWYSVSTIPLGSYEKIRNHLWMTSLIAAEESGDHSPKNIILHAASVSHSGDLAKAHLIINSPAQKNFSKVLLWTFSKWADKEYGKDWGMEFLSQNPMGVPHRLIHIDTSHPFPMSGHQMMRTKADILNLIRPSE